MTTHLFLVRHGETDFNHRGIVQGRGVDTDLNDTGLAQAEALGRRFAQEQIEIVYSSPLKRAKMTGAVLARHCRLPEPSTDPDLEEMSWGILEGKDLTPEALNMFAEMKEQWGDGNHDYRLPDGESAAEVAERGRAGIDRILKESAGKRIVVVAHGRFLRIILAVLLEEYGLQRMEELGHANTCVNHLVHEDGVFRAELLNCTAHLMDSDGSSAVSGL